VLGCAEFPINGYPIVTNKDLQCTNSQGLGWIVFPIFAGILLIGSFVLPTVLVGIVVVSFDEAQKRGEAIDEMMEDMEEVRDVSFLVTLPTFVSLYGDVECARNDASEDFNTTLRLFFYIFLFP